MNATFSPCQQKAYQTLTTSKDNVFLTGHAGTGKSFLIRHFLKTKDRKTFPVLASTGTAAVLIGGRTFHSFFGLGIMEGGTDQTVERALKNNRVVKRLREIDGFVLDEVSMISGPTLRAAETICRLSRKVALPWGGARVIATGDFSQLPPINANSKTKEWAFLDYAWRDSQFLNVSLETMMRTSDAEYTEILNHIRMGTLTEEVKSYLHRKTDTDAGQDQHAASTFLFPRRENADQLNLRRLALLKSKLHEIPTVYKGDPRAVEALEKQAPIPKVLHLKDSALVMIRINDPAYKYVNGSMGTVLDITDDELSLSLTNKKIVTLKKHSFAILNADGNEIASATNFPVSLAYATTIHKSQGATLDSMICDLRRLWEPGQAYVALSRLRTGAGLTLVGWDESSVAMVDPDVVSFYKTFF